MWKANGKFGWSKGPGVIAAAGLACICFAGVWPIRAQVSASTRESSRASRLLTAGEERAIVEAASAQDRPLRGMVDCSHVVYRIYRLAGFEYPYASSFEIYAGNESFERVKIPQPGDLIVWPGHMGIVVDPALHSFYSLVRTGWEAQDYEGPYWRSRGRPRFFRYKVQNREILTAARTPAPRSAKTLGPRSDASVIGESSPAETSASNQPPRPASERTAVIFGPPAPVASESEIATLEVPASIIIATGRKQPTREEVAAGISELSNAAGNILRVDDPMQLPAPIVIFERLDVERVEIKRNHGWARLQIETRASIAGGNTDLKRRREKVRWELRRTESGWEAITPSERTYVPRDVAVRNLARQLARLTESDAPAARQEATLREESQLAKLLSALLENH